jgi:hypothetical protein
MIYLIVSGLLNIVLVSWVLYLRFRKKPPEPKKELTKDATELLSELMSRGAVIVTQVVDPSSMFMYSPKDSQ